MAKKPTPPEEKTLRKGITSGSQIFQKRGRSDLAWDDEKVLPKSFSLDTKFVFQRMTEETIQAVAGERGGFILDVGCGRAIDAVSLAKEGAIIFGCDPSPIMLRKAKEWIDNSGQIVTLVRSVAENLPFRTEVFSRVYCKGAIDHFVDPGEALAEMCRVTKKEGKVIIAVANLGSLSCALARGINLLFKFFFKKEIASPHIWEVPADHNFKFNYSTLQTLGDFFLKGHRIKGTSLFWGLPRWSKFLKALPPSLASRILKLFDLLASWYAPWGDVLIMVGQPRKFR